MDPNSLWQQKLSTKISKYSCEEKRGQTVCNENDLRLFQGKVQQKLIKISKCRPNKPSSSRHGIE